MDHEEELQKKLDEGVTKDIKLLSQEQFDKILKERLAEKEAKHRAELEEVQKTAKMSAEEKQHHDFEALAKERDELKGLLAQKEHDENITKLMGEKKICNEFKQMFIGIPDIKQAGELMEEFNKTFEAKLKAEKENLINPHTPKIQTSDSHIFDDAEADRIMGIRPTPSLNK